VIAAIIYGIRQKNIREEERVRKMLGGNDVNNRKERRVIVTSIQ
jgi:hypothetical protein